MGQPAVFLDRDGTLIEEVGYPVRPQQIRILGGVARALARLAEAGFKRIVVTNQSAIARGMMTEQDLDRFHEALDQQLDLLGASVDAYYACPHHPDPSEAVRPELAVECNCRKPKPGLILQAAEDLDIDLASSWMVGDMWRDIQAGQAAGLRTVKLPALPSYDAPRPPEVVPPTAQACDLAAAVEIILGEPISQPTPPAEAQAPAWPKDEEPTPEESAAEAEPEAFPEPPPLPEPPAEEPERPVAVPEQPVATATEREESEAPASLAMCARCGQEIPAAAFATGAAGWRNGFPLCAECLSQQPLDAADRASESSTRILRDILIELRRIGRTQQPTVLSRLRLFAYMFQALALFVGLWGLFNQENPIFIQSAIFLQVLVVALLLLERRS